MLLERITLTPKEIKQVYIKRLEFVLLSMKNENSGATIHTVGHIRNIAVCLKALLEEDSIDIEIAKPILENVERNVVDYYKKKFCHLDKH